MAAESSKMQQKLFEIIGRGKFEPKAEAVLIKIRPAAHHLSQEEQMYFRKITEAIFGYSEQARNENLKSLACEYNVILIAPYLCSFIRDTIHCNLAFADLTLLIYAVRMTKCLLANPHLYLKPYIHEVLPAVLSCTLAKKMSKYYSDNHWTLRDFSAYVVANICEAYSDELNDMKQRVIEIYIKGIRDMKTGLATTYGAIKGLSCLGEEEVQNHLLPNSMVISNKIHQVLESNKMIFHLEHQKQQINEAKHVRNIMVTVCAPILYQTRNINDGGLSYVKEFGYLGKSLYIQVKNMESMEQARVQQAQYVQQINSFFHCTAVNQNNSMVNSNDIPTDFTIANQNAPRLIQTGSWYNIG